MEIDGYPNYLIYEDGRVYSKKNDIFLKHIPNNSGYMRVGLSKIGEKQKYFGVHRLIALHYIPNPKGLPEVEHIDQEKTHNYLSNLKWVTRQENIDARTYSSNTGERHIHYEKKHGGYFDVRVTPHRAQLRCDKYDLDDAINLRDMFLGERLSST